jgi:hypothetical protein
MTECQRQQQKHKTQMLTIQALLLLLLLVLLSSSGGCEMCTPLPCSMRMWGNTMYCQNPPLPHLLLLLVAVTATAILLLQHLQQSPGSSSYCNGQQHEGSMQADWLSLNACTVNPASKGQMQGQMSSVTSIRERLRG